MARNNLRKDYRIKRYNQTLKAILPCAICGSEEHKTIHHKVKVCTCLNMKRREAVRLLNRSAVVTCRSCHDKIHQGLVII